MTQHPGILVLDFDGVIHSYTSGWKGADVIPDPPVPGFFPFLFDMLGHGYDVHVFSSRSNQPGGIDAMRAYLYQAASDYAASKENAEARPTLSVGFLVDMVDQLKFPTEKPPAKLTIDDRAITFMGTWPTLDFIRDFKPWNKA